MATLVDRAGDPDPSVVGRTRIHPGGVSSSLENSLRLRLTCLRTTKHHHQFGSAMVFGGESWFDEFNYPSADFDLECDLRPASNSVIRNTRRRGFNAWRVGDFVSRGVRTCAEFAVHPGGRSVFCVDVDVVDLHHLFGSSASEVIGPRVDRLYFADWRDANATVGVV